MKKDNINYLVVGSVVLVALGILLYALYRLTGGVGENTPYLVHYPNVGGLSAGTPVTYEGYKIGTAVGIKPIRGNGKTRYRVTLLVRDGWPIPEDSVAYIAAEGLLAETVINIEEGTSNRLLEPGTELRGQMATDIFATVNDVASTIDSLLKDEMSTLLTSFNERLPGILDGVDRLVGTLQVTGDRLTSIFDAHTETQIKNIIGNGVNISENLKAFSAGLSQTRAAVDELLRLSHDTVAENRENIRRATAVLRQSLEDLAVNTETIMHNLDGASRNVNEFSRQIRHNPSLLLGSKPVREEGDHR